jgi:hypothetical protein
LIALQNITRVALCHLKVDFRKSHNGLYGDALQAGLDPHAGDLIIFIGRRKDRIKMLFLDSSGILLIYKVFHRLRLKDFQFMLDPKAKDMSLGQVAMLLEGSYFPK